ncbi:hypothetical protein BDZ97DRAFT_1796601, partial [Flammula alnicola]
MNQPWLPIYPSLFLGSWTTRLTGAWTTLIAERLVNGARLRISCLPTSLTSISSSRIISVGHSPRSWVTIALGRCYLATIYGLLRASDSSNVHILNYTNPHFLQKPHRQQRRQLPLPLPPLQLTGPCPPPSIDVGRARRCQVLILTPI